MLVIMLSLVRGDPALLNLRRLAKLPLAVPMTSFLTNFDRILGHPRVNLLCSRIWARVVQTLMGPVLPPKRAAMGQRGRVKREKERKMILHLVQTLFLNAKPDGPLVIVTILQIMENAIKERIVRFPKLNI